MQRNLNEVGDALERSSGLIARFGAERVFSAAFVIIISVIMLTGWGVMLAQIQKWSTALEKVVSYIDKQQYDRDMLNRRETNPEQVRDLSELVFYYSKNEIIDNCRRIHRENHIIDTSSTMDKLRQVVDVEYADMVSKLSNFTVKGKALSDFLNPSHNETIVNICKSSIYGKRGFEEKQLRSNLNLEFTKYQQEFQYKILSYK